MQAGDKVRIDVTVLRVDGDRVDTQTPDGQLIQTGVSNINEPEAREPIVVNGGAIEPNVQKQIRRK